MPDREQKERRDSHPENGQVILMAKELVFDNIITNIEGYAIVLLDVSGNIISWNNGAEKLTGYTSSEVVGKNFKFLFTSHDKENKLPQRLLEEAVRHGHTEHEELRVRKSKKTFLASLKINSIRDDNGKLSGFISITRDLTEQKLAEKRMGEHNANLKDQVDEAQELYRSIVSEVEDYAIVMLDADGRVKTWNKGAETITGYIGEEVLGENFQIFYTKEDIKRDLPARLLKRAGKLGRVEYEGWYEGKDDELFRANMVITAVYDTKKDISGYVCIARDMSERVATEKIISEYEDELKEKAIENEHMKDLHHSFIAEAKDYAVIMLDATGKIISWNDGAETLSGYTFKDTFGQDFNILFNKEERRKLLTERLLYKAEHDGRAETQAWFMREDGTDFWSRLVLTGLFDNAGKIKGFTLVTKNITDLLSS